MSKKIVNNLNMAKVNPLMLLQQLIPEFIMKYELKDIYNADETILQYRLLPSKSLSRKGDNPHGMKKSKDRIL